MSKGEEKISAILDKNNIQYSREYSFKDLKGKNKQKLRFDFAIFKNNKLKCLLEYDSSIHFYYSGLGKKINFTAAKERDRRKNSYCLARDIPLYRVPYWAEVKNIEDLFNEKFLVKNKYHNDFLIGEKNGI